MLGARERSNCSSCRIPGGLGSVLIRGHSGKTGPPERGSYGSAVAEPRSTSMRAAPGVSRRACMALLFEVERTGIEPVTSGLQSRRSPS